MAVFRIEKNSDFTIMPNYPFRDMRLSFKGRGLLGTMLTLRDDWDYTLAGLTAISPHGKSYVRGRGAEKAGHKLPADARDFSRIQSLWLLEAVLCRTRAGDTSAPCGKEGVQ